MSPRDEPADRSTLEPAPADQNTACSQLLLQFGSDNRDPVSEVQSFHIFFSKKSGMLRRHVL